MAVTVTPPAVMTAMPMPVFDLLNDGRIGLQQAGGAHPWGSLCGHAESHDKRGNRERAEGLWHAIVLPNRTGGMPAILVYRNQHEFEPRKTDWRGPWI
jgi:hypothetical protein